MDQNEATVKAMGRIKIPLCELPSGHVAFDCVVGPHGDELHVGKAALDACEMGAEASVDTPQGSSELGAVAAHGAFFCPWGEEMNAEGRESSASCETPNAQGNMHLSDIGNLQNTSGTERMHTGNSQNLSGVECMHTGNSQNTSGNQCMSYTDNSLNSTHRSD
eukprot:3333123-Alexandrium_andersonii.AAC.1